MGPPRARTLFSHLMRVGLRALIATLLLWLAVSIPLPTGAFQFFVSVRLPLGIFLFLIYMGKLLYDTFFHERYP